MTLKGLGVDHGVIVNKVYPGWPAHSGGMKPEDIILAVNSQPVQDVADFRNRIADLPVGTAATFSVDRDGKTMDLKITIGDREAFLASLAEPGAEENLQPGSGEKPSETHDVKFGIKLRELNGQERELVPEKKGIAVENVNADSFAEEIGMQAGDLILKINRQPVASAEDIKKIQQKLKPGDPVAFLIARPGPSLGVRTKTGAAPTQYLSGKLPQW